MSSNQSFYRLIRLPGAKAPLAIVEKGHIYEHKGIMIAVWKDKTTGWRSVEARTGLSFDTKGLGIKFMKLSNYREYLREYLNGDMVYTIDKAVSNLINRDGGRYVNRKLIDEWEVMPL